MLKMNAVIPGNSWKNGFCILCVLLGGWGAALHAAESANTASQQRGGRRGAGNAAVYKSQVTPHWFPNNNRFWYRNDLKGGAKEFILVDAENGRRQAAFDHGKLAAALAKAAGQEITADKLPFAEIEFLEEGKAVQFKAADKNWKCDLNSYDCVAITDKAAATREERLVSTFGTPVADQAPADEEEDLASSTGGEEPFPPQATQAQGRGQSGRGGARGGHGTGGGRGGFNQGPRSSPDSKWSAVIKNFNLFVRSEADGLEFPLTQDGVTNNAYGRLEWSPDSKALVAWRMEQGDYNPVYLVRSSPPGGGLAQLEERHYEQPGNKLTSTSFR